MPTPEVERFAELLLREVRDKAIASCDALLDPQANNAIASRWRKKIDDGSPEKHAALMIPECVDQTLFHRLHAIDSGTLRLCWPVSVLGAGQRFSLPEAYRLYRETITPPSPLR